MRYVIGVLFIFIVLLAGCDSDDLITGSDNDYTAQLVDNFIWDAGLLEGIVGGTVNGTVSVNPSSDDSIRVEVTRICRAETQAEADQHVDDIELIDDVIYDKAFIQANFPDDNELEYTADFDIEIPLVLLMEFIVTNGNIIVEDYKGVVWATIVNGSITCDMAEVDSNSQAVLHCTNGSIVFSMPADAGADFHASLVNGSISITGFSSVNYTMNTNDVKAGTIGSGGVSLELGTVNGSIMILPG